MFGRAILRVVVSSVAAATGAAYETLHGSTTRAARVRECGFFTDAATLSPVWLARPANTPAASTSVLGVPTDPDDSDAATVNCDTAWGTAPTTPTLILRRITLPASAGAGYVAIWNSGEEPILSVVPGANQWLVLWNPTGGATGSILDTYWKWAEG